MGLVVCTSGGIFSIVAEQQEMQPKLRAYSHIYFEISNHKLWDILIAFPLTDVIPWSFESVVVIWKQNIWQFAFGWSVTDSKNQIRAD